MTHAAEAVDGLRWTVVGDEDHADLAGAATVLGVAPERLARRTGARRPELSVSDDTIRLTMRTLEYDDSRDAVETGQLDLYVRGQAVVAAQHPSTSGTIAPLPPTPFTGPRAVASICRWVVQSYELVCNGLFIDIEEVEESVFASVLSSDAERIYSLKREVAEVRRAVVPLLGPLEQFAARDLGPDSDLALALRGLADRLHRLSESVDTLDNLLKGAFDAHVARISLQQNEDMRKISAAAGLVVVPSLIAGIYGMNFQQTVFPPWDSVFGFPFAILLMACLVGGLWWSFRKSGWL